MKKIILALFISALIPSISFATIGAGWNATSTDIGYIVPTSINGNIPFIRVPYVVGTSNATSTYAGGINVTSGCLAVGGTCITAGVGTGITSLNGLNGATQTFATTSANGGFGFSSSGTVHTLNIPTASASSLGLLSAADYIAFTAKQAAISFGTGVLTWLGTPTSANLAAAITDETGSGAAVFATSPTLVTPALGTPASGVATNLTGTASGLTAGTVTTNANLTGPITSVGNATTIASQTGTGSTFAMSTSPTLVTPTLGSAGATAIGIGKAASASIRMDIKCDSTFTQCVRFEGDVATRLGISGFVTGDANVRWTVRPDGLMGWGDGTNNTDTDLSRFAVNQLKTSGDFLIGRNSTTTGFLEVNGTGTSTFTGGLSAKVFNATSATASSTFANGIQLTAGCFQMPNGVCTQKAITLTTTGSSGASTFDGSTLNIPQYSGGSGSAFPFTTQTYFGQTVSATGTALRLTGSPYSLLASSTAIIDQIGVNVVPNFATLEVQGTTTTATGRAFAVWNSASSPLVTVTNSGTVGIGSSTPTSYFSINPNNIGSNTSIFSIGSSTQNILTINPSGQTIFRPLANSSGSFAIQNSGGTNQFVSNTSQGLTQVNTLESIGTGLSIFGNMDVQQAAAITIGNDQGNVRTAGGTSQAVVVVDKFGPSSSSGISNTFEVQGTITQSGTASGAVRGIYINPTLTKVVDYRALETAATTHNINLNSTTLRSVLFNAPTFASTTAATITNTYTHQIIGAPIASTNVTISTSTGLKIDPGAVNGGGTVTKAYGLQVSAPTGATNNWAAQFSGDVQTQGGNPTLSSCGTSPSVRGTDTAGEVTVGSVTASGCTISFSTTKAFAPSCIVTNQSMSVVNALAYTISTTALTITQTGLTGAKLNYQCTQLTQ